MCLCFLSARPFCAAVRGHDYPNSTPWSLTNWAKLWYSLPMSNCRHLIFLSSWFSTSFLRDEKSFKSIIFVFQWIKPSKTTKIINEMNVILITRDWKNWGRSPEVSTNQIKGFCCLWDWTFERQWVWFSKLISITEGFILIKFELLITNFQDDTKDSIWRMA